MIASTTVGRPCDLSSSILMRFASSDAERSEYDLPLGCTDASAILSVAGALEWRVTHKVIPFMSFLQLVPDLCKLRQHGSGDVVKSRVLAVHRGISRCEEIKKGLEGERRDRCACGCRERCESIIISLSFFSSRTSSPLQLVLRLGVGV